MSETLSLPETMAAIERAERSDMGIVRPVGGESVAVITRLATEETDQNYAGNVLRRTCAAVGETACAKSCALRGTSKYLSNFDKKCADRNLVDGLTAIGLKPQEVLMVAVTGNDVGFGDQLGSYEAMGKLTQNPEGWRELPGFNGFFARPSEVPAIGSRLADCAYLEFELKDRAGQTVIGFEHGSRPNMPADGKHAFQHNGEPVSYTQFVLANAIEHYGADPSSIQIRLSSSIRPENFVHNFENEAAMEDFIPGWQAAGFARNISNPDWQPGMPMVDAQGSQDIWHADFRGLILHDVNEAMQALGISPEQFVCDDMLDPADTGGEFSSYENRDKHGDARDLYLIAHKTAFGY